MINNCLAHNNNRVVKLPAYAHMINAHIKIVEPMKKRFIHVLSRKNIFKKINSVFKNNYVYM